MFFSESRLSRRSTLLYYAAVALNLKEKQIHWDELREKLCTWEMRVVRGNVRQRRVKHVVLQKLNHVFLLAFFSSWSKGAERVNQLNVEHHYIMIEGGHFNEKCHKLTILYWHSYVSSLLLLNDDFSRIIIYIERNWISPFSCKLYCPTWLACTPRNKCS